MSYGVSRWLPRSLPIKNFNPPNQTHITHTGRIQCIEIVCVITINNECKYGPLLRKLQFPLYMQQLSRTGSINELHHAEECIQ